MASKFKKSSVSSSAEHSRAIIAKNAIGLRVISGLTQEELARVSGLSRTQIARLEAGLFMPKADWLFTLADALRVKFDDFFIGHSDYPKLSRRTA